MLKSSFSCKAEISPHHSTSQISISKNFDLLNICAFFGLSLQMESWIIPLTILPGIGLFIAANTNASVALEQYIQQLLKEDPRPQTLVKLKIQQLNFLSKANVFFYLSALLFLLSTLSKGVHQHWLIQVPSPFLFFFALATVCLTVGILFQIIFASRAVKIKKCQFEDRLNDIS